MTFRQIARWDRSGPLGSRRRDHPDFTQATGLRDFTFHDLRHDGATKALNRGFTTPILMALGGWSTEAMVKRYASVTDQTLRAAAEAVAGNESIGTGFGAWHGNARGNDVLSARK